MVTDKAIPFLDLEFFWDDSGKLKFQVHQKETQLLKYLNKESTHTKATSKEIPNGVLNGLAKLTSRTDGNANISIKERYPDQDNALARSGLSMKNFPDLKELWEMQMSGRKIKIKRKRKRGGKLNAYFYI